jgi:hypothetical protein
MTPQELVQFIYDYSAGMSSAAFKKAYSHLIARRNVIADERGLDNHNATLDLICELAAEIIETESA